MLGSVSSSLYGLALSDLGGISKPHIIIIIIISCVLKTEFLFATILYTRSGYFKNFELLGYY